MEGEDPTTPHADEARHWLEVYDQLLTFKERTISSTQRNLAQVPAPEAREDVEETDLIVLKTERDRLQQRLDFWKRRHRELTGES